MKDAKSDLVRLETGQAWSSIYFRLQVIPTLFIIQVHMSVHRLRDVVRITMAAWQAVRSK